MDSINYFMLYFSSVTIRHILGMALLVISSTSGAAYNAVNNSSEEGLRSPTHRRLLSFDDDQRRSMVFQTYDKYYTCLEEKNLVLQDHVMPIKAELYQIGMRTILKCNIW